MSRREVLGTLGAAGAALVFPGVTGRGASSASERTADVKDAGAMNARALDCVVAPELTEGPFFVNENLNRSQLTIGTTEPFVTKGLPLLLKLGVFKVNGSVCAQLAGAQVDIWHASAEGVYSDERSGRIQGKNTVGERYLRGYQITDQNGAVAFATIYPGWYVGRTIHIHFKIRSFSKSGHEAYDFTSQPCRTG